jgi:uncharacterized protein YeeX (DUF496 family)
MTENPQNEFMALWEHAQILFKESSLGKKFKNPGDLLRVMLAGKSQGTDPYSALDVLYVDSEGKIVIPGVAAKAILIGQFIIGAVEEIITPESATVKFTDSQQGAQYEYKYTKEDAQRAGLWISEEEAEKDPRARSSYWYMYPGRMMMWKCWYNIVVDRYPHVIKYPIKEAVQEGKEVQVAIAPTQQTVVSDKVAKKSVDVVDEVLDKMDQEPVEVSKEEPVSDNQLEATRKTILKGLTAAAMTKMGKDAVEKIIERYIPDYKERIGGKRITEKKLVEFVLAERERLISEDLPGAVEIDKAADKAAKVEVKPQPSIENLPPKQEVEDDSISDMLEKTEKEVEAIISDVEVPSSTGIVIPPLTEKDRSGRPMRPATSAHPLYMDVINQYGSEFDDRVDEYLEANSVDGIEDISDLLTYGTSEQIEKVLAEVSAQL